MWKVELSKRDDLLKTLKFHSSFTALDKILTYKLSPQGEEVAGAEINFIATKDKSKKAYFIELSDLVDRRLTITYYNPGVGLSGLKEPMTILENDDFFFKVMFNTNVLSNSDYYQLSIEFFIEDRIK